jgi:hypothetical protein
MQKTERSRIRGYRFPVKCKVKFNRNKVKWSGVPLETAVLKR